jgi:hypothetical protein
LKQFILEANRPWNSSPISFLPIEIFSNRKNGTLKKYFRYGLENCIFVFSLFDPVSTFAENHQISENNASDLQVAKIVVTKAFQVDLHTLIVFCVAHYLFPCCHSRAITLSNEKFLLTSG